MAQEPALTTADLAQFTGTAEWYTHPLTGLLYTDGVQFLAERGGAYWLIDAIASWQNDPLVRNDTMLQEIQFWTLTVRLDSSAVLRCERDTGDVALTQKIEFTDFPLESIKLYVENGVLLLPSEH
jgi:hypothetical protein